MIGYYTLTQAATYLGLSKPGTAKAAKANAWPIEKVGNVHLFFAEDVHEYAEHRQRTKLVKALGWRGRGLYRASNINVTCPICGAFAVEWPAPPEVSKIILCVEEHKGEIE